MIKLTSDVDLQNKEAVRNEVGQEINRLNDYLFNKLRMKPLTRYEAAMVGEYIHAKLRGLIGESNTPNS